MKKVLWILSAVFLFQPLPSFAYDDLTTHPALTKAMVDFYNIKYSRPLSEADAKLIIQGSIDEDSPAIRSLNHFYDPVRSMGINNGTSAKDWALGKDAGNDSSFPKAVRLFGEKNEEEAFTALGHVLHLVADMAVPEHTRNDPHMGDGASGLYTNKSPYENWAMKNKTMDILPNLGKMVADGYQKRDFQSIDQVFDFLAEYSNSNFFSQDTIQSTVYSRPEIVNFDERYGYGINTLERVQTKLVLSIKDKNNIRRLVVDDGNDTTVLSEYFDYLSRQAVITGAGAIDIFLKEGDRARTEFEKKRIEMQAKIEQEAIVLNEKLSKQNIIEKIFYGGSVILTDKLAPAVSGAFGAVGSGIAGITDGVVKTAKMGAFTGEQLAVKTYDELSALALAVGSKVADVAENIGDAVFPKVIYQSAMATAVLSSENTNISPSGSGLVSVGDTNNLVPDNSALAPSLDTRPTSQATIPPGQSNAPQMIPGFGGGIPSRIENVPAPIPASPDSAGEDKTPPETPKILKPSDLSKTVNVSSYLFEGVGESGATLRVFDSLGVIAGEKEVGSDGQWSLALTLSDGANRFVFRLYDKAGNISAPTEIELKNDLLAPSISLSVSGCENSFSSDVCMVATGTMSVLWHSDSPDFSHFVLKLGGTETETNATSSEMSLTPGIAEEISVRSVDMAGNSSEPATAVVLFETMPVVINEVDWDGTPTSAFDEWIELYNRTDFPVNLRGMVLRADDASPYIIFREEHIIPAKSYFLIERKNSDEDDEVSQSSVPETADLWVSFGSGLKNDGEGLFLERVLEHGTSTIDFIPPCANWCLRGGDSNRNRTLERIDPDERGDLWENWGSSATRIFSASDIGGKTFLGSPKARNTLNYSLLPRELNAPEIIFTEERSPYVFTQDHGVILFNKKVKMESGAVLKFKDSGFRIYADLEIVGTPDKPVVLTALRDDEYGGDTDKNGTSTASVSGEWFGIEVYKEGQKTEVSHAILRYGGYYFTGTSSYKRSNLYSESALINVRNSIFEFSRSQNLKLSEEGEALIENNIFRGAKNDIDATGFRTDHGKNVIFKNNELSGNNTGFYGYFGRLEFENNIFRNNSRWSAMILGVSEGLLGENVFEDDNPQIAGKIVSAFATTTLRSTVPYKIAKSMGGSASVSENGAFHVAPGSTLLFDYDTFMFVDGFVKIGDETDVRLARLSSPGDDFSDEEGEIITPASSRSGIVMRSASSTSDISNAVVRFLGGGIKYGETPIYLNNVIFEHNGTAIDNSANPSIIRFDGVIFRNNGTNTRLPI